MAILTACLPLIERHLFTSDSQSVGFFRLEAYPHYPAELGSNVSLRIYKWRGLRPYESMMQILHERSASPQSFDYWPPHPPRHPRQVRKIQLMINISSLFDHLELHTSSSDVAGYRSTAALGPRTADEFISSLPCKTNFSKPSACLVSEI